MRNFFRPKSKEHPKHKPSEDNNFDLATSIKMQAEKMCSKDHQLRAKLTSERKAQKYKKIVKRVPAAARFVYTFGELGDFTLARKDDDIKKDTGSKRSLTPESKVAKKADYLKSQSSLYSRSKSCAPLTDMEKRLKDMQLQKSRMNRIIHSELKDAKSSWQEITEKLSMHSASSRSFNFSKIDRLYETLAKTTEEAENFHRSICASDRAKRRAVETGCETDFDEQKTRDALSQSEENNGETSEIAPVDEDSGDKKLESMFASGDSIKKEPEKKSLQMSIGQIINNESMNHERTLDNLRRYLAKVRSECDEHRRSEAFCDDPDLRPVDLLQKLQISSDARENKDSPRLQQVESTLEKDDPEKVEASNRIASESQTLPEKTSLVRSSDSKYTCSSFNADVPNVFKSEYLRKICFFKQ
uniref:Uncharacterized protein n=1 Tax=Trichogramma kaykai TaxID=54128 RepID=A0ABD2WNG5_9HYME